MSDRLELPADMVSAGAGLHANQAAGDIGEPARELAARRLLLQNDGPTLIEADQMEGVLANVDADRGDSGW